jgi:hypothetical protein
MALPASGDIAIGGSTIRSINYEFGRSNTATTSFSELYRGGSLVQSTNTNVPASGAISLDNFHNARQSGSQTYTSGSGNFTVPAGVNSITYSIVGGGGGGGAGYTASGVDYGTTYPGVGGGAGSGGRKLSQTLAVTPGQSIAYTVGGGGPVNAGIGFGGWNGADGGSTTFNGDTVTGGQKGTYHNEGGGGGNKTNVTTQGAAGTPGGAAGSWSNGGPGGAGVSVNGTTYGTGGTGGQGLWTAPAGTAGTGGVVYISWG